MWRKSGQDGPLTGRQNDLQVMAVALGDCGDKAAINGNICACYLRGVREEFKGGRLNEYGNGHQNIVINKSTYGTVQVS